MSARHKVAGYDQWLFASGIIHVTGGWVKVRSMGFFRALYARQTEVDRLPTETGSPDEQVQEEQFGSALQAALQQLSERQRQAFMLREWQGLSVAETAVAMGVSQGSVKTHLWRAIQALQVILQEYQIR